MKTVVDNHENSKKKKKKKKKMKVCLNSSKYEVTALKNNK